MLKRIAIWSAISCCFISGVTVAGSYKGDQPVTYKDEMVVPMAPMFRPYVGVNYVYLNTSLNDSVTETIGFFTTTFDPSDSSPNNFNGWSVDAGFRYGQFIGMEWGYFQESSNSKTNGNITVRMRPKGAYTEVRGYYPIDQVDLIGIAGVTIHSLGGAKLVDNLTGTVVTLRSDDAVTPDLGVGIAYNFNECWGIRADFRYNFYQSRYIDNSYTVDAGVYYNILA